MGSKRGLLAVAFLLVMGLPAGASDWSDCRSADVETSIKGCTRVIEGGKASRERLAGAYRNRAMAYQGKRDFAAAQADVERAIALAPQDVWAWITRGNNYIYTGKHYLALPDMEKAISIDAGVADGWLGKGDALVGLGNMDGACAAYERAIKIERKRARAHSGRAQCLRLKNPPNLAGALDAAERAVSLDGQDSWVYLVRGRVHYQRGDYQAAIADAARSIELGPEFSDGYYDRGLAYLELGDTVRALGDYNKALELTPDDAIMLNSRAWLFFQLGEYQRGLADADRSIASDSGQAGSHDTRGWLRASLGDLQGALADFDEALRIEPTLTSSLAGRGIALARLGRTEEALRDLEAATSRPVSSRDDHMAIEKALAALKELRAGGTTAAAPAAAAPAATAPATAASTAAPATPEQSAPTVVQPTQATAQPAAGTTQAAQPPSREGDLATCFNDGPPEARIEACQRRIASGEHSGRDLSDLNVALGLAYMKAGDASKGVAAFFAARQADATSYDAVFYLGSAYLRAGSPEAALNAFENAVALDAGRLQGHMGLGLARRAVGDKKGAAEAFRKVLSMTPANEADKADQEQARKELADLGESVPPAAAGAEADQAGGGAAGGSGTSGTSSAPGAEAAAASSSPDLQACYNGATTEVRLAACDRVLASNSLKGQPLADLLTYLSSYWFKQGNLDKAAALLEQARGIAPKDYRVLISLTMLATKRGDAKAGLALVEEALAIRPDDMAGHFFRAGFREMLGDRQGALEDLRRCVSLEPLNEDERGMQDDARKSLAEMTAGDSSSAASGSAAASGGSAAEGSAGGGAAATVPIEPAPVPPAAPASTPAGSPAVVWGGLVKTDDDREVSFTGEAGGTRVVFWFNKGHPDDIVWQMGTPAWSQGSANIGKPGAEVELAMLVDGAYSPPTRVTVDTAGLATLVLRYDTLKAFLAKNRVVTWKVDGIEASVDLGDMDRLANGLIAARSLIGLSAE